MVSDSVSVIVLFSHQSFPSQIVVVICSFYGWLHTFLGRLHSFLGVVMQFLLWDYFHPRDYSFVYNATMFTLGANEGRSYTEHVQT